MTTQFSGPPHIKNSDLWKWLQVAWQTITQLDNRNYTVQAPVTGFTYAVPAKIDHVHINAAGVLAAGTVTLPTTPKDGQCCGLSSTFTITALTVNAASGQTVVNPPSTLAVSATVAMGYRFMFNASAAKWYRVQ
jgi:hypothetical protein